MHAAASDREEAARSASMAGNTRSKRFEKALRMRADALFAELAELNERRLVQSLVEDRCWGNQLTEALHRQTIASATAVSLAGDIQAGELYADMVYAANYAKTRVLQRRAAAVERCQWHLCRWIHYEYPIIREN
eukprot:COSAG02_NODE_3446_length_6727_cov_3.084339_4_plen_134_part_00